ncbi:MAG: PAS domain S-box protein [Bacteroidales bacterium]
MDYHKLKKDELINALIKLEEENNSLKQSAAKRGMIKHENLINSTTISGKNIDLEMCLRELDCHEKISEIISQPGTSKDKILTEIANIIPQCCNFPEKTEASISIYTNTYKTPGHQGAGQKLSHDIILDGKPVGKIEIGYTGKDSEPDSQYLDEDKALVNSVAKRITYIIHNEAQKMAFYDSKVRYKTLIESLEPVIYEIDSKGIITYISPQIEKMTGYKTKEIIGNSFVHFVGMNVDILQKKFVELRDKKVLWGSYNMTSKSGKELWVRISAKAIYRDNEFVGGAGTMADITEQRKIKSELKESENKFTRLFNKMAQGAHYQDISGNVITANPASAKLLGLTIDQMQGREPMDPRWHAIHEDGSDYPPEEHPATVAFRTGKPVSNKVVGIFHPEQKEYRWMLVSAEPEFRDNESEPYQVFSTFTDITQIKRFENELKAQKNYSESILTAIPDLKFILNKNAVILELISGKEEELDMPPELFLGKNITEVLPPSLSQELKDEISKIVKGEDTEPIEYQMEVGNTLSHYEARLSPVGDDRFIVIARNTDKQKKAQEALRKSEQKLRIIADNTYHWEFWYGPDGMPVYHSPSCKRITGIESSELLSNSDLIVEMVHPDDRAAFLKHKKSSFKNKTTAKFQYRLINTSRELKYIEQVSLPVFDTEENFLGIRGTNVDITERTIAENALRENEQRLKNLVNSQTNYVLRTDLEGKHTYWNKKFEEEFGWLYPETGLAGVDALLSICEYHHQRTRETVQRCLNNPGEIIKIELDKPARDGSVRTTFWEFVCLSDENNIPTEIQCMGIDISDRRKAEDELLRSEKNYKNLFFNSPDGYLIIKDGKFIECNNAAVALLGGDRAWVIDKEPGLLSPEYQPNGRKSDEFSREKIRETFEKGTNLFEWTHKRADGTEFIARVKLSMMNYEGNQVLFTTWRDITKQRESEDRIRKLSGAVEQSPISIIITDTVGKIEYANPKACFVMGQPLEKLIGKRPDVLKSGKGGNRKYMEIMETISSGNNWQGEIHAVKKNGELYWVRTSISSIVNSDKKITNYVIINEDITQNKLAEQEIRLQYKKLNAIVSAMPDKIFVHDKKGTFLEFYTYDPDNMLLPKDKVIGTNLSDLFDEKTAKLNIEKINESIQKQQLITHEFSIISEGKPRFYEVRTTPLSRTRAVRFVRETTEKKIRDEEINKLSLAVKQSPVSIIITDLEGTIEYANSASLKISGYPIEELLGQNPRIFKSGHQDESIYKQMWETISTGKIWQGELKNKRKNGDKYWVSMTITPIFDENKKVTSYLAIKQDISQRKRAEQEIIDLNANLEQKIEERTKDLIRANAELMQEIDERQQVESALHEKTNELENFFSVAIDLLSIASSDGHFIKVNKAWENILGYSPEELENNHYMNFLHPEDKRHTLKVLARLNNQEVVLDLVNRYKAKDGSYRFIEWHSVPVGDKIYSAARDITERKNMEMEILAAKESAESANRAKSEFLANMSHEIRTPMNAILGYSELLESMLKSELQKDYLNSIKTSGNSLLTLINDFLDLSKIEAGKLDLEYEFIESVPFFSEFVKIFSFKISERDLAFNIDIASGTPAYLLVDGPRLRQVMLNLIGNAVKFTEKGGITIIIRSENPRVVTYAKNHSEELIDLVIEVADTGIGIPEVFQKEIFESFSQIKSRISGKGTGLGLAITMRLVELMNGKISVKSVVEKGSTFKIEIPDVPFLRSYDSVTKQSDVIPDEIIFEKATVLVIDDVEENRKFLLDALRDTTLEFLEAENGESALEVMEQKKPDLVITDIRMPVMDGFELLSKIKKNSKFKKIPVIAYSASVMKEQKERIFASEFVNLLIKPVQISELFQALMECIPYKKDPGVINDTDETKDIDPLNIIDPEGLVHALNGRFLKIRDSLKTRQPIDEVKNFGNELSKLGEKHHSEVVRKYGEDLFTTAENFNIEGMLIHLNRYQEIVKMIEK